MMEERKAKIMETLQSNLEEFHPALEKFVDKDYVTVIGSEVSSEDIVKLERGSAKKQQPFGTFIVQYDLNEQETLSQELQVTNENFADEWRSFKERQR